MHRTTLPLLVLIGVLASGTIFASEQAPRRVAPATWFSPICPAISTSDTRGNNAWAAATVARPLGRNSSAGVLKPVGSSGDSKTRPSWNSLVNSRAPTLNSAGA